MSDLLTIEASGALSTERRERMQRQARASKADATWAAYAADWRVWEAWAMRTGATLLPASPQNVAAFLSDMSASRKISTLRRYLASISVAHSLRGLALDRKHATIKTILKGIARESGTPVRRVKPLLAARVRSLLADMGDSLADARDAALLALGVASGCRRSELAGLDWLSHGAGQGILEIGEDGATIRLYRSKTSQAEPAEVHIKPGIALAAVKRWVVAAGIAAGTPLFRAIGKSSRISAQRLADRSIARIVKARCEAAGLDPTDFSGHSLRAGMVTSAAEAGVPEWRIKLHSRHKSDVVRQYIRPVEKRQHSPTDEIGL
jgi:integrase